MNQQPEALRIADALRDGTYLLSQERNATESELRRMHAEIESFHNLAEGCTPADAYILREANHALAIENKALSRDAERLPIILALVDRLRFGLGDSERKLTDSQLCRRAHELSQKARKWDEWSEAQNRVETEMPPGWAFVIQCSPDDWDTYLTDPDGERVAIDRDCDTLAQQMNAAIDAARKVKP